MRRLKNRVDGLAVLAGGVLSLGMIACTQGKSNAAASAAPAKEVVGASAVTEAPMAATDVGTAPKINAARAMQYTKEVTAFGARPIGSANHKKLEDYMSLISRGTRSISTPLRRTRSR